MGPFQVSDVTFDEQFTDEDGAHVHVRMVEPIALMFEREMMICTLGAGRRVSISRSEVTELGINPFTRSPTLITKDGYSVSVPVGDDPSVASKWFRTEPSATK